jgi:hypothetical protein
VSVRVDGGEFGAGGDFVKTKFAECTFYEVREYSFVRCPRVESVASCLAVEKNAPAMRAGRKEDSKRWWKIESTSILCVDMWPR